MKIVFATGNTHKLQEINEISKGSGIEFILPPAGFNPVENGETFEENSLIKAREAARVSGMIALADDSGLCVEALDGAPGIHSARYAQTPQTRIDKLLNVLKNEQNRKAKFVCAMTLVDKEGNILFQTRGECHGEIAYKQSGTNGFGYDPIFLIGKNGSAVTDNDAISHTKVGAEGKNGSAATDNNAISHTGVGAEGINGSAATNSDDINHTKIGAKGKTTMAEMSEDEKNEISHRGRALRKVLEYLNNN